MMAAEEAAALREAWFAEALHEAQPLRLGDQAGALIAELETVFVAGAPVAALILALAIIEGQLREDADAPFLNTVDLFAEAGLEEDYDWLRRRRNQLLHFPQPPALTVDMLWFQADALEDDAKRAILLLTRLR